jgi:hypothetical protein
MSLIDTFKYLIRLEQGATHRAPVSEHEALFSNTMERTMFEPDEEGMSVSICVPSIHTATLLVVMMSGPLNYQVSLQLMQSMV